MKTFDLVRVIDGTVESYTENIGGVEIQLCPCSPTQVTIERVFVAAENRGSKLLLPAIQHICKLADEQSIELSACIMPDDHSDESYTLLQWVANQCGFEPDVQEDGMVYRNDITRQPKPNTKDIFLAAQIAFLDALYETDLNTNTASWISDDLDYIEIMYYQKQPDGDNQENLFEQLQKKEAFTIGIDEAIWLLGVRINNTIDGRSE